MTPLGPNIWIFDGPSVTAALGFRYPTRMAAIGLGSGALLLWSPTALSGPLKAQIDTLGTVRHIVAPNHLHHMFLGDWQAAYPSALLHAAPGLRAKRPDIRFGSDLGAAAHPDWAGQVDQVTLHGNKITTEVAFFHRASRTAIFADMLQQLPADWFGGWRAVIARLDGMTGATPAVPRKFRAAFTDKAAARRAVRQILDWPTEQLLIAHGPPVRSNGAALLAQQFAWLRP